jgi:hypothetical protein
MPLTHQEPQVFVDSLEALACLSLAVGAALKVLSQEVPSFKGRS